MRNDQAHHLPPQLVAFLLASAILVFSFWAYPPTTRESRERKGKRKEAAQALLRGRERQLTLVRACARDTAFLKELQPPLPAKLIAPLSRSLRCSVMTPMGQLGSQVGSIPGRLTRLLGKCMRETGQRIEVYGLMAQDHPHFLDHFTRHRTLMPVGTSKPEVDKTAWVAPSATVTGETVIGAGASIWYGAVIRGDKGMVEVGESSNIQDDAVLSGDVFIGRQCTVGHGALISSTVVQDGALIGMKSVIGGSTIEKGGIVAAGSVVQAGTVIKAGEVWAGNPAVKKRDVTEEDKTDAVNSAASYKALADLHKGEFAAAEAIRQEVGGPTSI